MKKTRVELDVFLHISLMRMTKRQMSKWFEKHELVLYDGRIITKIVKNKKK